MLISNKTVSNCDESINWSILVPKLCETRSKFNWMNIYIITISKVHTKKLFNSINILVFR